MPGLLRDCARSLWRARVALFLVLAPALLALFKYSETGLNADIAINQVMALRNPTLFYWGQNRLFNIVPLAAALIRQPLPNLFAILFVAAASFFALVYAIAACAAKIAGKTELSQPVYLLNIFFCALLFKEKGWLDVCLWHFEYSLPLCLMLASLHEIEKGGRLLALPAAFVATGVNPGIVLVVFCIVFFQCFSQSSINKKAVQTILLYAAAFLIWRILSGFYGGYGNYSTLLPGKYNESMEKLVINLLSQYFNTGRIVIFAFLVMCCYALHEKFACHCGNYHKANVICLYCAISAVGIGIFISCIRWVHLNECAPRYLIFNIFMAMFVCSVYLARFLRLHLKDGCLRPIVSMGLLAAICLFLWPPDFNLKSCAVYNELNAYAPAGDNFYVGDYWQIWMAVSRDLNSGHDSHALGYRSEGDAQSIHAALQRRLAREGRVDIYCLDAATGECLKQLEAYFPDALVAPVRINYRNERLRVAAPAALPQ